jgi:hypothetical protein
MNPVGGLPQGYLTPLTDRSGLQMTLFSNQAPVFEMPYRNFLFNSIVSPNRIQGS